MSSLSSDHQEVVRQAGRICIDTSEEGKIIQGGLILPFFDGRLKAIDQIASTKDEGR